MLIKQSYSDTVCGSIFNNGFTKDSMDAIDERFKESKKESWLIYGVHLWISGMTILDVLEILF